MTSDEPTKPPTASDRVPSEIPPVESHLWVERHAEVKRLDVWWKEWLESEIDRLTVKSI